MNGACNGKKNCPALWGPGEGSKGQISFNFNLQSQFQIFLCQTLGALGVPRGSKTFFFKHGHVTYQINRDDEQIRMQVKFSS